MSDVNMHNTDYKVKEGKTKNAVIVLGMIFFKGYSVSV